MSLKPLPLALMFLALLSLACNQAALMQTLTPPSHPVEMPNLSAATREEWLYPNCGDYGRVQYVEVFNNGTAASGRFAVLVNGAAVIIDNLEPDESIAVSEYQFYGTTDVIIDPENAVTEMNEEDNELHTFIGGTQHYYESCTPTPED